MAPLAANDGTTEPAAGSGGRRRGGQLVLLGLVAVVVLVVVAVVWRRPWTDHTTVAIVGDSITEQGRDVLAGELSGEWQLKVDGEPGYTIEQQVPAARTLAESDPSQVIVNLGTNDVLQGVAISESEAALREVVAAFPRATCIHLVDVNEDMLVVGGDGPERARAVNEVIRRVAAEDARIDVVSWAGIVDQQLEAGQPDGPILVDTIHPSQRGKELLTEAYAEALAACG